VRVLGVLPDVSLAVPPARPVPVVVLAGAPGVALWSGQSGSVGAMVLRSRPPPLVGALPEDAPTLPAEGVPANMADDLSHTFPLLSLQWVSAVTLGGPEDDDDSDCANATQLVPNNKAVTTSFNIETSTIPRGGNREEACRVPSVAACRKNALCNANGLYLITTRISPNSIVAPVKCLGSSPRQHTAICHRLKFASRR